MARAIGSLLLLGLVGLGGFFWLREDTDVGESPSDGGDRADETVERGEPRRVRTGARSGAAPTSRREAGAQRISSSSGSSVDQPTARPAANEAAREQSIEIATNGRIPADAKTASDVVRRANEPRPFGEYARKVGTAAEHLELEVDQEFFYHEVLIEFAPQFEAIRKGVDPDDEGDLRRLREKEANLQAKFDKRFIEGLSPQQVEAYLAMPDWVRRPDPALLGDTSDEESSSKAATDSEDD